MLALRVFFPQDAQLTLSRDQYSDGLRRQAAFAVSEQSFDKASESRPRHTTAARRSQTSGREHYASFESGFRCILQISTSRGCDTSDLLVLTCDGKDVVMRQEDLRPGTQKRRKPPASTKKQTRLGRGEKRKCMATIASVYDIEPHYRSADSIIGSKEQNSQPTKPGNKRVWASVEKSHREVIEQMFAEARRRDPNQKREWAVLVDGQPLEGSCRYLIK